MKTMIALVLCASLLTACEKAPQSEQPAAVEQRDVAAADPQVAAVLRDFPEGRLVSISIPGGETIVLDRRKGCIYQQYRSLQPILDADGKPDCTYANRMTIESPPVRN